MRVLTMVGAACAAAVIAPAAGGTPVLGARAVLSGNMLTLGFDVPVTPGSACRSYLQWAVRDRVVLAAPGNQDHGPMWADTFTTPLYTYDACARPRRVVGQPFATITRPRPGVMRVTGARNDLSVPWSEFAQVCIRITRTTQRGVASDVTCVRTRST